MRLGLTALLALATCVAVSSSLTAQVGSVSGRAEDASTGAPLGGVTIEINSAGGQTVGSTITNRFGAFRAEGLSPGTYSVVTTRLGYMSLRVENVVVGAQPGADLLLSLEIGAVALDPVMVTAQRSDQTILSAPVAASVVNTNQIEDRVVLSTVDHMAALPGAQVISGGVVERRYTVRGQNFGTSANLRTMTDYRYTVMPNTEHNLAYLSPDPSLDIERIELIRGPASAIYGPNTHRGVLHVITKSPFDSPGTSVSIGGGERSAFMASVRQAWVLNEQFALKISGDYLSLDDFAFEEPSELQARQDLIDAGADPDTLLVGLRDFTSEKATGELRLDWRPNALTEVVLTGGMAQAFNNMDLVSFEGGANQIRDASLSFVQARLERGRLSVNAFTNKVSAGDSYLTANGLRLIDESRTYVGHVQHGFDPFPWQRLTYGAEVQRTLPDTRGTLHGPNEDSDDLWEVGGYLNSEIALSPSLDFIASVRADYHNIHGGTAISPRVATVWRPAPTHALRLSYGRAHSTFGSLFFFTDAAIVNFGAYDLRLIGLHEDQTFRRDCGGLCMRSPFNPGGADEYLPVDGTPMWPAIVQILAAGGLDLSGVTPPTAAQVGSELRTFSLVTGAFEPSAAADVVDAQRWQRLIQNTFEFGYKGLLGERVRAEVDLHYNDWGPVAAAQSIMTPNVFYDVGSLTTYLEGFMPPAAAAGAAAAVASIPLGTVTPEQAFDPTALLLVQRQGKDVTFWGMDLAVQVALSQEFSGNASYSWTSEDSIPNVAAMQDYVFNNAKHRGSLGLDYRNADAGFRVGLLNRFVGSFPGFNGFHFGRVDSYWVTDATVNWDLPGSSGLTLSLSAYNVFDNVHRELPGLPDLGRVLLGRVRWQI